MHFKGLWWLDEKIIPMYDKHTEYEIDQAFITVLSALQDMIPFCYGKVKRDGFGFDQSTYDALVKNFKRINKALLILAENEYIMAYTILPRGVLRVKWQDGEHKSVEQDLSIGSQATSTLPVDIKYRTAYQWKKALGRKTWKDKRAYIKIIGERLLHGCDHRTGYAPRRLAGEGDHDTEKVMRRTSGEYYAWLPRQDKNEDMTKRAIQHEKADDGQIDIRVTSNRKGSEP